MSDFFKKFLLEDPRRLTPGGRYVGLAAFGKHPGWDDHVEDLGLETESLNFAKTVLYVKGIGGQIDSGAWEKLDAAQQLPAFDHLFVWQRSGQILIGRLWSSSDGKGRTRYPMVICLHFVGVTLGSALKRALPALAELDERCVQTTSAEEVRGLLDRKRAALRETSQSTDLRGEYAFVSPEVLHKILQPSSEAKREGFLRVLYQIQSQMGAFAPDKFNGRANPSAIRAQQIRVPSAGETAEQALVFWSRFFLTKVDASVPLLLTLPLEGDWMDVTAGEPESQEFFCLRASPKAVPLVSEVPYTLDDAFRAKATAFLNGFLRGETTAADLQPAATVVAAGDSDAPAKGGWRKWLAAGAIIIIGAVATMVFLRQDGKQQAKVDASDARPKADMAKLEADRLAKEKVATPQENLPEQKYQTALKAGRAALNRKEYAEAISQAGVALENKAKDQEATQLLTEAQRQLDLANTAKAQEQKYQTALKSGRAALNRKEYAEAISQAGVALENKAKDQDATQLLTEAQRQLDLANTAKEQGQQRKAAEAAAAKEKADEQAKAKMDSAAANANKAADPKTAAASPPYAPPVGGEITNGIGMVLVPLPSGIWVGKYEVTQAEYRKVMKSNPSKSVNDRQPVEQVSWNDAKDFCRKLTEMERGKWPAGQVYTLPTEKQWTEFLGGQKLEDLPGRGVTGRGAPAVVGKSGPANKFGLFDVLGNVWEWCLDDDHGQKVLKGGAFNSTNSYAALLPDKQVPSCGFRCILAAK
jgi:formylglycine-generating enzyme required for sulfatase activity